MYEGRSRDEADRLVGPAELDQARDRVELVRELVRLRPEGVREAANAIELAEHSLELGPVTERHDGTDGLAPHHRGHAVRDEDAVPGEQHLVAAAAVAGQDVAHA